MSDVPYSEALIRLGIFFTTIALLISCEFIFPKIGAQGQRLRHYLANFSLLFIGTAALRLIVPLSAVGAANLAAQRGWGLFNTLSTSPILAIILCVLLLDLLIYFQHVLFHKLPFLWRLHQVHHADRHMDLSTGVRFHPVELLLSTAYKCACIALLGASLTSVIIFEILLSSASLFSHSNIRIPTKVDYLLRKLIVTPDMHRIHHSSEETETNTNYGFFIALWDKLFGTYTSQGIGAPIGLKEYMKAKTGDILWNLRLPFAKNQNGN